MGDCLHFSLRFNYDNPKHRKIIDTLDSLDKREYSSKTKFIITALDQYIDWLELEEAGKKVVDSQRLKLGEVVTWGELDEALKSLKAELKAEMYEKFFQFSGESRSPMQQPMIENSNVETQAGSEIAEDITDDLSKYAGIMESVLSWSEDE